MELLRTLGVLAERPEPDHARLAREAGLPAAASAAEGTDLFRFQLPPYASVYLGADGMLGGGARDRVAGFWRAMGVPPPPEPDHLTTLLGAYASLREHDADASGGPWSRARHAFFWEHVASWIFPYLARVEEVAGPFHRAWASVLAGALGQEAEALAPPARVPAALAEAGPVATPGATTALDDLISAILSPARSGMIVTRRDLAAGADRLGLGLRQGERRFVLRWLVRQAPAETLTWMSEEASRQASLWARSLPALRPVMGLWWDRASATAATLVRAAGDVSRSVEEALHA